MLVHQRVTGQGLFRWPKELISQQVNGWAPVKPGGMMGSAPSPPSSGARDDPGLINPVYGCLIGRVP